MVAQDFPRGHSAHDTFGRVFVGCVFACTAGWLAWLAGADVAPGDSGEIGTAAYLLGVAHPTGFPLDLLVLRLASFLPLGSIAWRQSVAVGLISAAVLAALAQLTLGLSRRSGVSSAGAGAAGATVAVCGLLCFGTFLGSALGVEVYSTALLLVEAAALTLLAGPVAAAAGWTLFGLALGAHVTAGYLMLPLLMAALLARPAAARARYLRLRMPLLLLTAAIIAYLPLAARRDTAADWGDPETLGRLFEHLTAARIRSSFSHEMFHSGGAPSFLLAQQLGEHPWLLPAALLGLVGLLTRARAAALVLLSVLTLDLAYAVWVNPMGIAERQLGHASGAALCLLAGVGVAQLGQWLLRWRGGALLGFGVAGALALATFWNTPWPAHADAYVTAERLGSGSPLSALPPRAAYVCTSDSACAGALFAVYVEAARPDVAVAPGQHLWDATVLRRLTSLPSLQALAPAQPLAPTQRRALVERVLRALLADPLRRPLVFESEEPLRRAGGSVPLRPLAAAPFLVAGTPSPYARSATAAQRTLNAALHARFGAAGPPTAAARLQWSGAYDELGKVALHADDIGAAVAAESRAVALAPARAVGLSNLGVALEAAGSFERALEVTRRAVLAAPERPAAWVNLIRLEGRLHGMSAARDTLNAARLAGVRDPRLDALARALDQGSTR